MSKTPMTPQDASRIQSSTDRKGHGDGFKERAQSAAAKNENAKAGGGGSTKGAPSTGGTKGGKK